MKKLKHKTPLCGVAIILLFICGCANKGEVILTEDGIIFKGDRPCLIKYKDDYIDAEYDSRGQPLINFGDMPDLKVER